MPTLDARRLTHSIVLLPPALLALAHAAAALALVGFGWRAGAYPFHPRALWVYWAAVPLALLALGWLAWRGRQGRVDAGARGAAPNGSAVLLAWAPALASLSLVCAVWLSPALGGAPFTPYGIHNRDFFTLLSLAPAVSIAVVAAAHGAPGFLAAAGSAHLLVYFLAMAGWWPGTGAGALIFRPYVDMLTLTVYGLGLVVALLRPWLFPRLRLGLWLATAAGALLGGWLLVAILSALPGNGSYMDYLAAARATTLGIDERMLASQYAVPANAWDWLRPAALGLASLSMLSALVAPLVLLAAAPGRQEAPEPAR